MELAETLELYFFYLQSPWLIDEETEEQRGKEKISSLSSWLVSKAKTRTKLSWSLKLCDFSYGTNPSDLYMPLDTLRTFFQQISCFDFEFVGVPDLWLSKRDTFKKEIKVFVSNNDHRGVL